MRSRAPGVRTTTSRSATTSSPSRSTSRIHPQYDGSGVENHGFGVLFGSPPATAASRWWATCSRTSSSAIRCRAPRELVFVNNLVYDRGHMDVDLQSQDGRITQELDRRQRVPARAELRPRHASDLRAHQRQRIRCSPAAASICTTTTRRRAATATSQLVTLTGGDVISSLLHADDCAGVEHGSHRAPHGEQCRVQPRAELRRRASHGSRLGRPAHRRERQEPQWPDHQLRVLRTAPRVARRTPAAGRATRRTAHADAARESELDRVERLHAISRTGCTRWTRRSQGVVQPNSPTSPPALSVR